MKSYIEKANQFKSRNKILVRLLAMLLTMFFLMSGLSTSAAALKKEDFAMVFNTDGITVGDESNNGIPITFDSGSFGVRLTYMNPVHLDGLKIVLKNVSIRKGSDTDGVGLWMTFSQEAGHYWGDGATGTHMRISTVDTLTFYAKKADSPDEGEGVFYKPTPMKLKGFPITTTITINKVGSNYEISINNEIIKIEAAKIDSTISSTGQCYWNFGVTDDKGQSNSFVIAEISNTKQVSTTTTKTTTTTTTGSSPTENKTDLSETETTLETEESDYTSSTNEQSVPAGANGTTTTKPVNGSNNKSIVPIIIIVAIIVIAGAVVAFILIKKKKDKDGEITDVID